MSNSRELCWTTFAIVLVVACHLFLDMRGAAVSQIVARGAISTSADTANAISIRRYGEQTVVLSKASGEWRLVSPFRASADSHAVLGLLDALAFVPVVDSMDASDLRKLDRSHEDFGLDAPRVEIEILGPSGGEKIAFGDRTPAGDGVFAAVDGESSVFVVMTNVFASADRPASEFRSHELFDIGANEVGAFDIKRETGSFVRFMRDGNKWQMSEPDRMAASSAKVRRFVSAILDAKAVRFVWPVGASNETEFASASLLAGYGLDPDSAVTLTFKGIDGIDRQVSFGNDTDDGQVYAVAQNGGVIVTVDAALKDSAVRGVTDFVDMRLFPVEEQSIGAVSIADGDMLCVLAKGSDGSWRMDSPLSAPADSAAVEKFVSRMLALNVTDASESGVAVSLATNAPPVMIPRDVALPDGGVETFRSKEIVRIEPLDIRRLVVSNGGAKPISVVYDASRRTWNVESSETGGIADIEAVNALASALNPLLAKRVVAIKASDSDLARFGLESAGYAIAVDRVQENSVRRNILIGGKADGGRYVTIGSSGSVFVVPDSVVKVLSAQILR